MKPTKIIPSMSTVAAILAGVVIYVDDLDNNTDPLWLIKVAGKYKSKIALGLFCLTVLLAICDWLRAYSEGRNPDEATVAKILEDLSVSLFPDGSRQNRITLFKCTTGWRVVFWGLIRLPIVGKSHKWRALSRVKWQETYLSVYLRPMDSKGRRATTAFHVSDNAEECEGMAGRVWDKAGLSTDHDLPRVDIAAIRKIRSQSQLDTDPVLSEYASRVNMLNYKSFDVSDHFARHFLGTLIRVSDGTPWGVLLLDSFEDTSPFIVDGKLSPPFVQRFNDFAKLIGKIVG